MKRVQLEYPRGMVLVADKADESGEGEAVIHLASFQGVVDGPVEGECVVTCVRDQIPFHTTIKGKAEEVLRILTEPVQLAP